MNSEFAKLMEDIRVSFGQWRLWVHLGWSDVVKQYRRSFLGPVWITLSTGLFVVAFGLIGAQLFKQSDKYYLSYFATGHITFAFFSSLLTEGCATFTASESYLKQSAAPKFVFVFRVIVRNLAMLGHNAFIIIAILLWFGIMGEVRWVDLLVNFSLCVVAAFFVVSTVAAIATRFRDVPLMISTTLPIMFFLTPVMWRPDQLTERARWLVVLNPFAIFLDLIREPLLGQATSRQTLLSALLVISLLIALFVPVYVIARRRIVYWL